MTIKTGDYFINIPIAGSNKQLAMPISFATKDDDYFVGAKLAGTSKLAACKIKFATKEDEIFFNANLAATKKQAAVIGDYFQGFQGYIYAGGQFTTAGGISANRIAKLDGSTWSALGSGLSGVCYAMASDSSDNLYVGGDFTTVNGLSTQDIAMWNGASWSLLGNGLNDIYGAGYCTSLAVDESDNLYAVGNFYILDIDAGNIAMWDGSTWNAVGTSGWVSNSRCVRIGADGNVYVSNKNRITMWNGTSWSVIGGTLSRSDVIRAMAIDSNNNIYIGGQFNYSYSGTLHHVAKLVGSTWTPLGSGLNGYCETLFFDADDNLYVGGGFTTAGGISAKCIAKLDGSTWSALGSGLGGVCYAIEFDSNGNLYAGGDFTTAGGVTVYRIAKWNGSSWSALGSGLNSTCYALCLST